MPGVSVLTLTTAQWRSFASGVKLGEFDLRLIRLEPLAMAHAPGYLAAAGTGAEAAEVFRWLSPPGGALAQPVTVADAAAQIEAALDAWDRRPGWPPGQVVWAEPSGPPSQG